LFFEDARRILAAVDRARERVQSVASGTMGRVRLGATETAGLYLLPAMLERYRQKHPQFALQFAIGPEVEILERVAANDLDMAVISGTPVLGELRSRRIGQDDLLLVAMRGSALRRRRRLTPGDLREESWILREDGSDTRRQTDAWFKRNHVAPSTVLTLQGADAVKRAVVAGLGIGVIGRSVVAEELRSGRVVMLRPSVAFGPRDVHLVDHPHKHHGAACTAMLAMLTAS
jgi:DNA-binding transcriptional LysR family regulator